MKIVTAIVVSSLSLSSIAFGSESADSRPIKVSECSDSLYTNLNIFSSAGDSACSHGRTDAEFQKCTITISNEIGNDNVDLAGRACAKLKNIDEARCAIDLYFRGGLYVYNYDLNFDGQKVCSKPERALIQNCIVDLYQKRKASGQEAARVCVEKYDPQAIARREAEKRRQDEELRKQVEARKKAEAEAREKAKKREEDRKKEEEKKKQGEPKKTDPPKSDNGGGVIVDLPNFQ